MARATVGAGSSRPEVAAPALSAEQEAAEVLEQMREAGIAPEPGGRAFAAGEVVHKGDSGLPAPMVVGELQSAGHVYIYDPKTGDRSVCNRNMLPAKLRQRREDGSPAFTLRDPGFRPAVGAHRCLLHPDGPQRAEFDALGLPTCPKANLRNPYQVRRHMQASHKQEWAAIEEMRQQAEREAEREFRRSVIASAGSAGRK